jgi:hypothetical protein
MRATRSPNKRKPKTTTFQSRGRYYALKCSRFCLSRRSKVGSNRLSLLFRYHYGCSTWKEAYSSSLRGRW